MSVFDPPDPRKKRVKAPANPDYSVFHDPNTWTQSFDDPKARARSGAETSADGARSTATREAQLRRRAPRKSQKQVPWTRDEVKAWLPGVEDFGKDWNDVDKSLNLEHLAQYVEEHPETALNTYDGTPEEACTQWKPPPRLATRQRAARARFLGARRGWS